MRAGSKLERRARPEGHVDESGWARLYHDPGDKAMFKTTLNLTRVVSRAPRQVKSEEVYGAIM
jgi:hypothetical protein